MRPLSQVCGGPMYENDWPCNNSAATGINDGLWWSPETSCQVAVCDDLVPVAIKKAGRANARWQLEVPETHWNPTPTAIPTLRETTPCELKQLHITHHACLPLPGSKSKWVVKNANGTTSSLNKIMQKINIRHRLTATPCHVAESWYITDWRLTICSTKAKSCCSQLAESHALPSTKNLSRISQINMEYLGISGCKWRSYCWCHFNSKVNWESNDPRCYASKSPKIGAVTKVTHASIEVVGHAEFWKTVPNLLLYLQGLPLLHFKAIPGHTKHVEPPKTKCFDNMPAIAVIECLSPSPTLRLANCIQLLRIHHHL